MIGVIFDMMLHDYLQWSHVCIAANICVYRLYFCTTTVLGVYALFGARFSLCEMS